jgi:cation diffusion facilitator family transporter
MSSAINYEQRRSDKRWAALSSVAAAVLLTSAKLVVAMITGSLGILSEALHSGVDLAGTVLSYAAIRVSDRPPDATHPYGHAKYESVAALVAVALLSLTALGILREAGSRIFETHVVPGTNPFAFAVMAMSVVVDFTRSRYLRRVAERHGSQALAADATHFATDLYSSLAVITGLAIIAVGGALGWPRELLVAGDALAGAIVAGIILVLATRLAVRAINALTDRVPPDLVERVSAAVANSPHTLETTSVRVRYVGDRPYADVSVKVPRGLPLELTEEVSNTVTERVQHVLPNADVVVHTTPQAAATESVVDAAVVVAARHGVDIHHVRAFRTPEGLKLDMHMEVAASMRLQAAHEHADRLEAALREEIAGVHNVDIHIEPRHQEFHELARGDTGEVTQQVERAAYSKVKNGVHDIEVLVGRYGYVVTLHCYLPAEMPVAEAHYLTAEIERSIREQVPGVYRVTVHPEPLAEELHIPLAQLPKE